MVDVIFVITLVVNQKIEEEERQGDMFHSDSPHNHRGVGRVFRRNGTTKVEMGRHNAYTRRSRRSINLQCSTQDNVLHTGQHQVSATRKYGRKGSHTDEN